MKVLNFTKVISACLLLIFLAASNFPFAAHRYHTSLTRMDFNEKEKVFEVSIQLFTHDLVPTLEKKLKKSINLEKNPETDRIIFAYLNEKFVLKDKQNNVKKTIWVGKEVETDTVNVYLEIPFDENPENLSLQNTIFFESFAEQTNLVIIRHASKKYDLVFKSRDEFKEFKKSE